MTPLQHDILTAYIMNNLRILKAVNPGDTYYEEYLKHLAREGEKFFDQYHFAVIWALEHSPKRILEIGTRSGLSICQLLSAHPELDKIEEVSLCDLWNDGFISEEVVKIYLASLNIKCEKISYLKGDSKDIMPLMIQDGRKYDYILVDGDHQKLSATRDLENAVQLIEKEGVIVFDDISPYGCDLKDVWEEFKAKHKGEFIFEENYDGKGVGWAVKI